MRHNESMIRFLVLKICAAGLFLVESFLSPWTAIAAVLEHTTVQLFRYGRNFKFAF